MNAAQQWTDDEWNWADVRAGAYLAGASLSLYIPDPITTFIGWSFTKGTKAITTSVAKFFVDFGKVMKTSGSTAFMKRFIWAAGITHLITLPWQIREDQIRKEREGVVDYMAAVPLEPGQSPPMNPAAWSPQGRAV